MRSSVFKKMAAVLSACAVIASAVPAMNVSAGKMLVSDDFGSGVSAWGTYKESGGDCVLTGENGRLAFRVNNDGRVNHAAQFYYDIIPLYKGATYRLKFDISCTTNRRIEAMLQQNGGTYQAYTWLGLDLTPEVQSIDKTFTMEYDTDIMSKLVFNCGSEKEDYPAHTIYVDNVSLELLDDSGVNYDADKPYEAPIVVNQVGFTPNSKKTAVFRKADGKSSFTVVNADTKQTAYTGTLSAEINNPSANENDKVGDFSEFKTPGRYYIACEGCDDSYEFEIGDNVYGQLLDDSVRMLYLQRCGVSVEEGKFSHPACHTGLATIYRTNEKIDVSGGWHDAGDYGRYVVPGAKAVADLLYAYEFNGKPFSDSIGIPESGNGTPDVLDEARFELEWMLKMQRSDGGVYHKVSCEKFPSYCAPQEETDPLIVTPVSSTATADFCASMALAADVYAGVDSSFAQRCRAAAEKAWSYLEAHPNFDFTNPSDITTGDYGDKSDIDERYWAAAQMYRMTGESKYADKLGNALTGMNWMTMGDYGNIAILTMKDIDKNSGIYQNARSRIISEADSYLSNTNSSPYGSSLTRYEWGSNMPIATNGMTMNLAYRLTGEEKYLSGAQSALSYLLGQNPLAKCFVTGFGTDSPQHPHHRPSMAAGTAMKGMLVGGVDSALEDSAAKAYCQESPAAKRYVDNSESYSTNEITIYWNSPLTALIAMNGSSAGSSSSEDPKPTEPTDPTDPVNDFVLGDVNADGSFAIADVVAFQKWLVNKQEIANRKAGDMNADGKLNVFDLNIMKQRMLGER